MMSSRSLSEIGGSFEQVGGGANVNSEGEELAEDDKGIVAFDLSETMGIFSPLEPSVLWSGSNHNTLSCAHPLFNETHHRGVHSQSGCGRETRKQQLERQQQQKVKVKGPTSPFSQLEVSP